MNLQNFEFKKEIVKSWNNTLSNKAVIIYPKSIDKLTKLIKLLDKNKKKYLLRTGSCSYDSKSINPDIETFIISLKYINKILKIDLKNKTIDIESGALIADIVKKIKNKNLALYSVPGGNKISIGGAISANVIGKDSSASVASFGDALLGLHVLKKDGKIKKLMRGNKNFYKFIGAFGLEGIIIRAKLKVKKTITQNLRVKSKILKSIKNIKDDFDINSDYHYIQIDPFFRKENFAVSFRGYYCNLKDNLYKKINLNAYKVEEIIFKVLGKFINLYTWKIFYKLFFLFNSKLNKVIDIHNFHYSSKYKHLIPLVFKNGLLDYEILIKKNFSITVKRLINFLKKNEIYPTYIIVKKIYKSKDKYRNQFNENGFSFAISFNKSHLKPETINSLMIFLKKSKLKINLSKTDDKFVNFKKDDNYLFSSLYKKMLLDYNGISGTRT